MAEEAAEAGAAPRRWLTEEAEGRRAAEAEALAVKSLALFIRQVPHVVVLPAHRRLDPLKAGRYAEPDGGAAAPTGRRALSRQVRMATAVECVEIFGHKPGTVPPLAHRSEVPVLLDASCAAAPALLGGSGAAGMLLRLPTAPFAALPFVTCVDLALDEAPEPAVLAGYARVDQRPAADEASAAAAGDDSAAAELAAPAEAAASVRFLVDGMMGRLLRWLRVLGVDSLLREEAESAGALFRRAERDGRILLTRDRKLPARRDCKIAVFVVASDEPKEQLREVVHRFGIRLDASEFMMRCAVCNGRGYHSLTREEVEKRGDCPPKVLAAVTEFFACRSCAKLYWEGPKSLGSYDLFASIFESFAAKGSGDAAAPLGPPEARVASLVKWSGAP